MWSKHDAVRASYTVSLSDGVPNCIIGGVRGFEAICPSREFPTQGSDGLHLRWQEFRCILDE